MTDAPGDFAAYFAAALDEALSERNSRILGLRYGLADGTPRTLETIAQEIGVSRERIRQLLVKSLRIVRAKGRKTVFQGAKAGPTGQFLLYMRNAIRPGEPGDQERLFAFVQTELADLPITTHVVPLIAHFVDYEGAGTAGEYGTVQGARLNSLTYAYVQALEQAVTHERHQERFATFLDSAVLWPSMLRRLDAFPTLARQREVNLTSDGEAGTFRSRKLGRDVQYESLLEFVFFRRLDEADEVVAYQEQPFRLQYAGTEDVYVPDVFFMLKDGRGIVAEIKKRDAMVLHENMVKWPVLRDFCKREGYGRMITDGRTTIQAYYQRPVPPAFREALRARLAEGPLFWPEYRALRESHGAAWDDLIAAILQDRLVWTLQPFRLMCAPERKEPTRDADARP
jgi:hypothetical protein